MEEKDKDENDRKSKFSLKAWKKMFGYLGNIRKLFFILSFLVIVMVVCDICFPLLQAYIIDNFIEKKLTEGLALYAALYAALVILLAVMFIFFSRTCIKFEMLILKTLRNSIFKKFQELPLAYFNNRSVGYLVSKTMSDTERIGNTISWGTIDIGWNGLYIILIFIPMFIINYKIALLVMLIVPLALILSILFENKLLKKNREIRQINSNVSSALNEGITGAKTIQTLNAEQKMTNEFKAETKKLFIKTSKYNRMMALYVSLLIFLGSFVTAVVIYLGGNSVIMGMEIGLFSALLSYTTMLINPVMMLAETITNLVANQANVERTLRILEETPKIYDSPQIIEKYGDVFNPKYENWEVMEGDIEFKNVSFKYDTDERYILKDFNLKIPKGSSLAVVGETGAGKTTIVNLLCRFYEPTEGEILIDGVDYRQRGQIWLTRNLGYVLQSPHLFSGTVRDNIKYSNPDGTDQQMIEVSKLVSADTVVSKLEKGYDSEIGECGDSLSMGEKQLLTFARAIYNNPKIIIMDEATSSIDTETERSIQSAITNILKNRTSIMIAHRLSTIKSADKIILLENGRILEEGSHNKLMKNKSAYYNLYTKMFENAPQTEQLL